MYATITSGCGREFAIGAAVRPERCDALWFDTWLISHDGKPAGWLYSGLSYGVTRDGSPRWHASTRQLHWRVSDVPTGLGFDVAAFDTAEEALKAWCVSADEILDWIEGKPVRSFYAKNGFFQRTMPIVVPTS